MADLSDITAYLYNEAIAAVYPTGSTNPSVIAPMDVRIFEGWPEAQQLDLDLGGKLQPVGGAPPAVRPNGPLSNVSIYPMQGMGSVQYQILDHTYVISQPVYGLTVGVVGTAITITGTPGTGEYVSIIADRAYVFSATGATAAALLAALLTQVQVNYPLATVIGSVLTIPYQFALVVRQGGVGVLGKVTHRQKHSVMVTIWSPDPINRKNLSAAVDIAIKNNIRITLPDTSQAIICYNRTNYSDDHQVATVYRRDLIYDVEYATVYQFPGYVITSVDTSVANYNNSAIVPAVT